MPVVIYNGLRKAEEARLFIDINTKQRPVPNELLLDIKRMAETETDVEALLRDVFDLFAKNRTSPLLGLMSSAARSRGKISRVTFNTALRPIWNAFAGNPAEFVYQALSAYLRVWLPALRRSDAERNITNPTLFRAIMLLFPAAAERVSDRHGEEYTAEHFSEILDFFFSRIKKSDLDTLAAAQLHYTTRSKKRWSPGSQSAGGDKQMSLLADALQPQMVQGILGIAGRLQVMSVPDAIISPRAAYDLDFDNGNRSILFDFRDAALIVTATASDCCRFSGSAFQTVSSIALEEVFDKQTLPWEIIKLYDSAFYAGQTLIRLLGEGCSFFDARHISRIDALAQAMGKTPTFKPEAGLYRCTLDPTVTKLSCIRIAGGTHESFWNVFGERLSAATAGVLQGPLVPSDAQAVFAQLEAFDRLIGRHGSYHR